VKPTTRTTRKLPRLLGTLREKKSLLIVMQDSPDPDAVAAAAALRYIANQTFGIVCTLAHGGAVGRAENRALVRYLDLNLRPLAELGVEKFDLVAVVDTQPATGNNSLPDGTQVDIVFDHHPIRQASRAARFTDVRRDYGATSTILFEYLQALNLEPPVPLATGLCYGIRSDTQDLGRESTKADIGAFVALYPSANKRVLGRIQFAPEPAEYFRVLATALRNAVVYGKCVVSSLGEVNCQEIVAETADLLVRYEAVSWALTFGSHDGVLHLSLRTGEADAQAGRLMQRLVLHLGSGGGHASYAGGQIPLSDLPAAQRRRIEGTLVRRLVRRVHGGRAEGRPLMSMG